MVGYGAAEEGGAAEGEHSAVGGYQAVGVDGEVAGGELDGDARFGQLGRAHASGEVGAAEGEHSAVGRGQAVAVVVEAVLAPDDAGVQVLAGHRPQVAG